MRSSLLLPAATLTYPTLLLSRNSDSLVLSLWDQLSLLQIRSLALLLHVSDERSAIILRVVGLHQESLVASHSGNTHSRSVALSVFMNSCLARRRMSGSNLSTERWGSLWDDHSLE